MNRKSITRLLLAVSFSALYAGCGGGGSSPPPPPDDPPPPPPPAQSVSGLWTGSMDVGAVADVTTSFEADMAGPFTIGTSPYSADFSAGVAQTVGNPDLYHSGAYSWHIPMGTVAVVTFETNPDSVSLWTRTELTGDVAEIRVLDDTGATISTTAATDAFQEISEVRTAGMTKIGSIEVDNTTGPGDIVVDDFTMGFESIAASTQEIRCVVAETNEMACHVNVVGGSGILGGITGTLTVANTDEVSGTGTAIASLGQDLPDGSDVAALTLSNGMIVEDTTISFEVAGGGIAATATMDYDSDYDRASSLATVNAVYTTFAVFGNASSLNIDAAGAMDGSFTAGGNACMFTGTVSEIDTGFNAYDINMDVTTCGLRTGVYDGLGFTRDFNAVDDRLVIRIFSATQFTLGTATK